MPTRSRTESEKNETESRRKKKAPEPNAPQPEHEQMPDGAALQRAIEHPERATPNDLLHLQHHAGNRAVRRLIQRKLQVGAAHDHYEQEADWVANQVVNAPMATANESVQRASGEEQVHTKPLADSISPLALRANAKGELATKSLGGGEGGSHTYRDVPRENGDGSFETSASFEQQLAATRGGGSPLPEGTRREMENKFGADFGNVRVHTGSEAVQLNRHVSAQAFTHGSDIYLGAGKADLESGSAKYLFAHELTHVIQQGGARPNRVQTKLAGKNGIQRLPNPFRKKKTTEEQKVLEKTGEIPKSSKPFLYLKLVTAANNPVRGNLTLDDLAQNLTGHAHLELDISPDFPRITDLEADSQGQQVSQAMDATTKSHVSSRGRTSYGLRANRPNMTTKGQAAKFLMSQMFTSGIPGFLQQPEQAEGQGHAAKTYVISTPQQARGLFSYISAKRNPTYNLLRYNCTDFAAEAVKAAGFAPPSGISNKLGITTATQLYKKLYQEEKLGDQSIGIKDLSNPGQKHISDKAQKKLNQRIAKIKPGTENLPETRPIGGTVQVGTSSQPPKAPVLVNYTARGESMLPLGISPDGLSAIGFVRRGDEFGVTGVVIGEYVQIVFEGDWVWAHAQDFKKFWGADYPRTLEEAIRAKPKDKGKERDHDESDDEKTEHVPAGAIRLPKEREMYVLTADLPVRRFRGGRERVPAGKRILVTKVNGPQEIDLESETPDAIRGTATAADFWGAVGTTQPEEGKGKEKVGESQTPPHTPRGAEHAPQTEVKHQQVAEGGDLAHMLKKVVKLQTQLKVASRNTEKILEVGHLVYVNGMTAQKVELDIGRDRNLYVANIDDFKAAHPVLSDEHNQ